MSLFDSKVKCKFMKPKGEWLLTVEPITKFNPFEWITANKPLIDTYLVKYGGILFRNFDIYSVSEFNKIAQIICPNLLEYVYRSTPRTKLGGKIYTATDYPMDKSIPFHNENSYSKSWPEKILFFSIVIAQEGGETPIANSFNVYNRIDHNIRNKFEKDGIIC